ncbi:MAG TPA: phosphate ABC transporter, permease protein PstA, partial [Candidatus Tectomicrobia bacterium]|nr:phosphate ABC transporter, permease protein PstA [Candidatus Tectomicrobia bacterium]
MTRLWRSGEPFVWLTGGAVACALIMVGGLIAVIMVNALGFFWPAAVVRLTLDDGAVRTGQVVERERVPGAAGQYRVKLEVGNRDLYGADFVWIDEARIVRREQPPDVAVVERTEWGTLIGTIVEVREHGAPVATGAAAAGALQ